MKRPGSTNITWKGSVAGGEEEAGEGGGGQLGQAVVRAEPGVELAPKSVAGQNRIIWQKIVSHLQRLLHFFSDVTSRTLPMMFSSVTVQ